MPYKFSKPFIIVGCFPIFWLNASDKLWAGSVDIINTFLPCFDNKIDNDAEIVVLPTPPLPPTNIHFSVF